MLIDSRKGLQPGGFAFKMFRHDTRLAADESLFRDITDARLQTGQSASLFIRKQEVVTLHAFGIVNRVMRPKNRPDGL